MPDRDILILRGHEVSWLLVDRELELIDVVRRAYAAHSTGDSSLPFSSFLRFPNQPKQRIIAVGSPGTELEFAL